MFVEFEKNNFSAGNFCVLCVFHLSDILKRQQNVPNHFKQFSRELEYEATRVFHFNINLQLTYLQKNI